MGGPVTHLSIETLMHIHVGTPTVTYPLAGRKPRIIDGLAAAPQNLHVPRATLQFPYGPHYIARPDMLPCTSTRLFSRPLPQSIAGIYAFQVRLGRSACTCTSNTTCQPMYSGSSPGPNSFQYQPQHSRHIRSQYLLCLPSIWPCQGNRRPDDLPVLSWSK